MDWLWRRDWVSLAEAAANNRLMGRQTMLTVTPSSSSCRVGWPAWGSTNWGRKAKKNRMTLGFRTSVRKAYQKMEALERRASGLSEMAKAPCLDRSALIPR